MLEVTDQPEMLILNKYLGFGQLEYLESNKIDCVLAKEYDDFDKSLDSSSLENLWSVRIAARFGQDFNLPSIIGVDKNTALSWIKKQSVETRYIFMYSKYFEVYRCGRIHIDKIRTLIESKCGDFQDFKTSNPDLTLESDFGFSFFEVIDNGLFSDKDKIMLIELANCLKGLYKEEIEENHNLLYEFDFAFGCYADKKGIIEDGESLKVIGMRSYIIKEL